MSSFIVLFDGPCTLCNKSAEWIVEKDVHQKFVFGSLQGTWAAENVPPSLEEVDSVLLFDGQDFFSRSDAAIRILQELPGYKWTSGMKYVPRYVRDSIYKLVARSRYSIFGKGYCALLPKERLVD